MVVALDAPRSVVAQLAEFVAGLEPDEVEPSEAVELFAVFAELSRLGSAGQILLAPRVAESDSWRRAGHGSAASWMARASGTPTGEAITALETAQRLEALPATRDALRRGSLSGPQVREISAAATTDPEAEAELLEVADGCSVESLRGFCRQVTSVAGSAAAEQERYARVRRSRFLRHRSGPDGAVRGEFMLAPEAGARFVASLEQRADELSAEEADEADATNDPATTRSARRADALVDLVTHGVVGPGSTHSDGPPGRGVPATIVHLRVDATALRRGYVEHGEVCEIPDVGPVPVATARSLIPEAFLELLVTDGDDIVSVCHAGWGVPQHVRDALVDRDPRCAVPGCNLAVGLEVTTVDTPGADDLPMAFTRLARICGYHNFMKAYQGFTLRGGPVKWAWDPPPGYDSS